MGAGIGKKYSPWRALFQAKQPPANLPQHGEKPLIHGSHQIARAQRAAGPARRRADDPLDQLHVLEAPLSELLLVLEQRLGKKKKNGRAGPEIEILELHARSIQEL